MIPMCSGRLGVYKLSSIMMSIVFPAGAIFEKTILYVRYIVMIQELSHLSSQPFHEAARARNNPSPYPAQIRNLGLSKKRVRTGFLALHQINSINMYCVSTMAQAWHKCWGEIHPSPFPHHPSTALGVVMPYSHWLPHMCRGRAPRLMYISGRGGQQREMGPLPCVAVDLRSRTSPPALAPSFNKKEQS